VIPKVLFQTSRRKPSGLHTWHMSCFLSSAWEYRHFSDEEALAYMRSNNLTEFPDIIEKYLSMPTGAHKADLFRYYFMYLEGGVFLDYDAALCAPVDQIAVGLSFFSVRSSYCPGAIFQGFIGAVPKSEIILAALKDAYLIDIEHLRKNYHQICMNLTAIVEPYLNASDVILFNEAVHARGIAKVTNDEDELLVLHYFAKKKIPIRVRLRDLLAKKNNMSS